MSADFTPEQRLIKESIAKLCEQFDDQYWLDRDTDGVFPEDFCRALADAGWMGIAMPEEYGGSGLGITEDRHPRNCSPHPQPGGDESRS